MSRRPAQQANPPSHSHYPPAVHAQAAPRASVQLQDPRTPVYYNATQPGYPIQPGYGPGPRRPPPPDPVDVLFHRISQILASYQSHTDARLNRIDNNIQKLTTELFSARSESRDSVTKIAELLQTSHGMQTKRLRRLEDMLGFGAGTKDHQNQKSLGERFDVLSFAVEEFLERLRDPEANLPDGPLHHDMATSPPRHAYADAEASKTPISKRRFSVAVGSPPGALSADQSSSTLVPDESIFNKQPEVEKAGGDLFGEVISRNIPKTTFAAVSPVTRPLVPADWDAGSPAQQSFSFNPDRSPAGMAAYSVVPNRSPSVDGSVASLRQTALGNSVGPLMSTPRRSTSVHSVSPAPHVSRPHSSPRITPLALDTCDPPRTIMCLSHPPRQESPRWLKTHLHDVLQSVCILFSPRGQRARIPGLRLGNQENTIQLQSPSADTLGEELSVLGMMASPDPLSNLVSPVSPVPLLRAESQPPILSSVSPLRCCLFKTRRLP
ncbi:Chromo domain-containing protein [Mycena sanguinolenta]|uniref:Chromo domain-containing protein n=1 Tax=Mycena sanguinolenta TaxID=230812 RepID=A0A8H7CQJ1_9AGAR|nr:Chromo domain-containing protein [Mycena sanguinolenta]